ncbi:uncharacterized protein LAESUDRAFT_720660 [Laetiporus sulphureus 93-53]|uniref:Uncharacterized protein n=1 Tax=Laetiporus sulphureus 93-53 TaxID=1314785 RepID=A0A165H9K2_9APHY|nr:uncharacterized protein LAESUDRAFT_720660 [Laetiporus sulphureus 93-53]KZT11430.1 hypothetical protein LAESUDRAFT_720660 [Laetiporus sulphureus 93-53]
MHTDDRTVASLSAARCRADYGDHLFSDKIMVMSDRGLFARDTASLLVYSTHRWAAFLCFICCTCPCVVLGSRIALFAVPLIYGHAH